MYTTKNLITKSWGRYKISDPEFADKLAYLNKALGMNDYSLYEVAYKLYRSKPYIYDWYKGTELLIIKVAMEEIISTLDTPLMNTFQIYTILRNITDEVLGKVFIEEPWARYSPLIEETQRDLLEKLRGFQYFKPDSGFNKISSVPLIFTIFRACYIWAWSIDHLTPEEFNRAHQLYYDILFRDIDPEYKVQAKNVILSFVNNLSEDKKNTQIEFY